MYAIRLLSLLLLLATVQTATAVTAHRGRHYYLTLLGSNIKFPIFTKQFAEGSDVITVGGIRELWLADERQTLGLRFGFDDVRSNGSGLGFSLTFWRGAFADEEFLYDRQGPWQRLARYRDPTHTFLFLDLNTLLIPWESGYRAFGLYGLFSLIGDYEQFKFDRYSTHNLDPTPIDLTSESHASLDLRFGFGLGTRLYLSRRFSVWLEKRWIVGERFTADRTFTEGGFYESGKQKTLYSPINSLGLSLAF